jgi:hypothetical protein
MSEKFFLSPPGGVVLGPGERLLWSGNCAVAEYAFEQPASLPRWTLPEETDVAVTDERVIYRDPATTETGELRWVWPQHLRVQPGKEDSGRSATATQIQLVCAGPAETYPALVFAGGDLVSVGYADRLANLLRQTIARFRVEHAHRLGLSAPQARMLSRLVMGPEFTNYQGGQGQTVSLLGALPVEPLPVAAPPLPVASPLPAAPPLPAAARVPSQPSHAARPSHAAEATPSDHVLHAAETLRSAQAWHAAETMHARETLHSAQALPVTEAWHAAETLPAAEALHSAQALPVYEAPQPAHAPEVVTGPESPDLAGQQTVALRWNSPGVPRQHHPDPTELASRAADLAARVAMLVSEANDLEWETRTANLAPPEPPAEATALSRAESVRRTAARLAGNAPRGRNTLPQRRPDEASR